MGAGYWSGSGRRGIWVLGGLVDPAGDLLYAQGQFRGIKVPSEGGLGGGGVQVSACKPGVPIGVAVCENRHFRA